MSEAIKFRKSALNALVGNAISTIREKRNEPAASIEKRVNLKDIKKIESGEATLTVLSLFKIGAALHVPPRILIPTFDMLQAWQPPQNTEEVKLSDDEEQEDNKTVDLPKGEVIKFRKSALNFLVGKSIYLIRDKQDESVASIEKKANVKDLKKIEVGEATLTVLSLFKIGAALHVPPRTLIPTFAELQVWQPPQNTKEVKPSDDEEQVEDGKAVDLSG